MLQSSERDLNELLSEFNIKRCSNDTFIIEGEENYTVEPGICKELVEQLVKTPSILKCKASLAHKPSKSFYLCAWFIAFTDISHQLAAGIFTSPQNNPNNLRDFSFICKYIKNYVPEALVLVEEKIHKFYCEKLDSELKPLFIDLLLDFVPELSDTWKEILYANWRDGKRDLATASLKTLLKSKPPADFFQDYEKFERIDSLQVLTHVLLATGPSVNLPLFQLFRNRLCIAIDSSHSKRFKTVKLAGHSSEDSDYWTEHWTQAIQNLKIWPSASTEIHSVDLLSKLALSGINSDKTSFKAFINVLNLSDENVVLSLLSEVIPTALDHCAWLHECLPRPLLQLFAHILKTPTAETSQEVLLSLCRLFMDSLLGTSARKRFVNYLAANAQDNLIDSRYVCLVLIKSLLEGVDTWEPRLLEPFYSSFSLMARSSDSVMNDLILLLKKQIYSSDVVYKRIGARGVGVFLSTNGLSDRIKAHEQGLLPDPDDSFNDIASCSQKPRDTTTVKSNYHLRIIISLLEESVKSLRSDRQSMLIFFKYIEECFNDLDEELKEWIGDWTRSVFQSSFLIQIDDDNSLSYKYEQDEDNPLALNFCESDFKDCAPIMLSILGKFENGNLEGIDALQGCAIQCDQSSTLSADFQLKFVTLNYFRSVLNTFPASDSRFPIVIELQRELKSLLKSKAAFLAEFKFFPEGRALLQQNLNGNLNEFSVVEGSFLDELLKETRKTEVTKLKGLVKNDDQLCDLTEGNFIKSLVPLQMSIIQKLTERSNLSENETDFLCKEIDYLIEFKYKNDFVVQSQLLDCLFKISSELTVETIEIICKCKKGAISAAQRAFLLNSSKEILETVEKSHLIPSVCKLLIDILDCPDQISDPLILIKSSLISPSNNALKHLLTLSSVNITTLFTEFKNTQFPLKNRLILLKGFGLRLSKQVKHSTIEETQIIFSFWAELIQNIRSEGNLRLLHGIVKESHVILESLLTGDAIKMIESEAMLLENSGNRDSVLLLLKTVQQSTRGLQIICNHLKYSGAKTAPSDPLSIPNLKKSLESVIFRVKDILTRSGCLNAFWMGNLKHRDLDGQELSSQVELLQLKDSGELSEKYIEEDAESESVNDTATEMDNDEHDLLNDISDDSNDILGSL